MLTVLGGLAEFERALIMTRTGEGRTRAIARGVRFDTVWKTAHWQTLTPDISEAAVPGVR
jgi:DNA invertase Pin-like site-specific DNA recombinase